MFEYFKVGGFDNGEDVLGGEDAGSGNCPFFDGEETKVLGLDDFRAGVFEGFNGFEVEIISG